MKMVDLDSVNLHYVESVAEVDDFMRWLSEDHEWLAFDLETGGLEFWNKKLRLFQFGDSNTAWAFRGDRWLGVMEEVLSKYEGKIVGHNVYFDVRFSEFNGITVPKKNLHDTMNMAHIIDPVKSVALKTRTSQMLSPQAKRLQGALEGAMKAQGWGWDTIPVDFPIYHFYGAFDCILTSRLAETYWDKIQSEFRDVYDLEMQVSRVCSNMEFKGTRVDLPYCSGKYDEFTEYCQKTEEWCLENFGVMPSENQNVAIALIREGVDLSKTTASGLWSTDKDVLEGIEHPLAQAVLGFRKASKLKQSYFRNFLEMNDHGILHPSIRTLGARTARMSVREPALQTLPQGPVVRNGFIPREGMVWVSADFANVEMRLLAHFSGDPGLLAAASTSDMHLEMAKLAYHDEDILKADHRRQTMKNANFAKAYVAGNEQFARTAGIDLDSAIAFLDMYDERFPGVKAFQRNVQNVALERYKVEGQAYIKTPLGRRHPSVKDKIYTLVNYLIQGTAADSFKQSLVDLDMAGFGPYMLMPVHDEQNFEIPAAQLDEMINEIEKTMRQDDWSVPLTVTVGYGPSWGAAK
jgi:DNA polymerase-1